MHGSKDVPSKKSYYRATTVVKLCIPVYYSAHEPERERKKD